ncbi:MAG: heat-inducible transcription repressor HrcA [Proteobacteria bacterium]|nr:heat-inducible transcription repressor HrcA [Pseudomonadota bacterium]
MVGESREASVTERSGAAVLSERAQRLLTALVEAYIRDGQPVGSRTLTRESGLAVSAATVRNVMADLEEYGFVASPHTSAGRVPTDKGYRFFVDALMRLGPGGELDRELMRTLEQRLVERNDDPRQLVASASQLLSNFTSLAGVVTVPRHSHAAVTQIEFLSLSENRVLAILVVNGREVQNRILEVDRRFGAEELRRAAGFLNEQFGGRELSDVRALLLSQLQETRASMNQLMLDAISMAQKMFAPGTPADAPVDVVIAGETNLMGFAELSNVEKLRRLFDAFNEKRDILHLLDQCLSADRVQIFIGQESGYRILDDLSVVTAPYTVNNEVVGVLGVIGPTRMAYERVIPIVDLTARLLGSALNQNR